MDPYAMLGELQGRASDRKARLAAVAAFRQQTVPSSTYLDSFCQDRPPAAPVLYHKIMALAERLAEGGVTHGEVLAQEWDLGIRGEDIGLVSQDPLRALHSALNFAEIYAKDCGSELITRCAQRAWDAAGIAAWTYWRQAMKDHPVLNGFDRIKEDVSERVKNRDPNWEAVDFLCDIRRRDGIVDYWYQAREYHHADETRNEKWNAAWRDSWCQVWEAVWNEGWSIPWPDIFKFGSSLDLELQRGWEEYIGMTRDRAWEIGPPDEDWSRGVSPPSGGTIPSEMVDAIDNSIPSRQAGILRDIFGNIFHPASVEPRWLEWNNSSVRTMAQLAYDEQRFENLAILGDSLRDAGCGNEELLAHCRSTEPHFRGCWVIDLLLRKQ
ncbi:MAG: hypothetical protein ACKVP0_04705 [Pirellulaceae bacterium]